MGPTDSRAEGTTIERNHTLSDSLIAEYPDVNVGYPVIAMTRIAVRFVVQAFQKLRSFDATAEVFPQLQTEQIQAALDYYKQYPQRVDEDIERNARAHKALYGRTARLSGPDDKRLFLTPLRYAILDARDMWDDWVEVFILVKDGPRDWGGISPIFLTRDLPSLVRWFRQLADSDPDARESISFIEPALRFTATGRGEVTRVTAYFGHELHPDWKAFKEPGRREELRPTELHTVAFEPGAAGLRQFADKLEQQLRRLPERFPEKPEPSPSPD